jgi:hypothetical protein
MGKMTTRDEQDNSQPQPPEAQLGPIDRPNGEAHEPAHFDVASLRIDPATETTLGAKPLLLRVPVEKPNSQDFVRCRSEAEHRTLMYLLTIKEKRETYAVLPSIAAAAHVRKEVKRVEIRVCVNLNGAVRLWPVPMPTADERTNPFNESHQAAAEAAEALWIRVWADMTAGQYVAQKAEDQEALPQPKWPDQPLDELIVIAFKGRIINTLDHPVLKALRGAR